MSALPKRFTGRKPRVWVDIVTREVIFREELPLRRVPWFREDGTILLGNDTVVIGPWRPWRVRHRFAAPGAAKAGL